MSPIEQAKILAAYWREEADDMHGYGFNVADDYVAKARETAAVLEQLIEAVQRP